MSRTDSPRSTMAPEPGPPRTQVSSSLGGWLPPLALTASAFLLVPADWPRWAFMWVLSFAIFCGCKWLTWRRTAVRGVPSWKHAAYLFAWPGLDAESFLSPGPGRGPTRPTIGEWLFAFAKLLLGAALLFGLARWLPPGTDEYGVGWVGMIGIVLILHFGIFHALSCWWRWLGIEARPLMNWPVASVSVSEFWGRRWNTAFRDLTHRFLFRPLTLRLGPRTAIGAGFLFSGLVHDLVISGPPGGGYGGPTLFFIIQGLAIFAERSRFGRKLGLGEGWRGWSFTAGVLLGPAPLLFHPPFVKQVIVPFMQVLGAIPCQPIP